LDFTFGGDFVAGEARFRGSVRARARQAALDVLARESTAICDAEEAGFVLTPEQLARKSAVARELVDLLFAPIAAERAS
jgi:hypothetical protein